MNYVAKWCFHCENGIGGRHDHFQSETQFTMKHAQANSQYCSDIQPLNSEIQLLSYKAGHEVGLPCTNLLVILKTVWIINESLTVEILAWRTSEIGSCSVAISLATV